MSDQLSIQVNLDEDYEVAIEKVTAALKEEGFGVLTEINVKATLKKKIDVDFRRYIILGACKPPLAHRALSSEPLVGLLLPCNVTVEETDAGGALVNFLNPMAMMTSHPAMAANVELQAVAEEATACFKRAAAALN